MKKLKAILLCALPVLLSTLTAHAWHVGGQVRCPNGLTFNNITINIDGTSCDGPFSVTTTTDSDGLYLVSLPDCDGSYTVTLVTSTLPPNASVVGPATQTFSTTVASDSFVADFEIGGDACEAGA